MVRHLQGAYGVGGRLRLVLLLPRTDMAGGVGLLGEVHVPPALFPFCLSAIMPAEIAFRVVFEGLSIADLQEMLPSSSMPTGTSGTTGRS